MLWILFKSFFQIGLFSVGGGYAAIPLIQDIMVTKLQYLTMSEFTDLITIAEMTPGPISINSATFVGNRLFGFWGALVSSIAVITPSIIICLMLAFVYYKYRDFKGIKTVLGALRPIVVALIANAGLSIFLEATQITWTFKTVQVLDLALFGSGFYLLRKYKLNPIIVIIGSGFVGVLVSLLI